LANAYLSSFLIFLQRLREEVGRKRGGKKKGVKRRGEGEEKGAGGLVHFQFLFTLTRTLDRFERKKKEKKKKKGNKE